MHDKAQRRQLTSKIGAFDLPGQRVAQALHEQHQHVIFDQGLLSKVCVSHRLPSQEARKHSLTNSARIGTRNAVHLFRGLPCAEQDYGIDEGESNWASATTVKTGFRGIPFLLW